MRLLLDENLSSGRIGERLRESGNDVLAIAGSRGFEGLPDLRVLELASRERRVLVTRNGRDFVPLLREWAEASREHAGAILIWSLDHHELRAIVESVEHLLAGRPSQEEWRNLTLTI